jgi:hypothetical protein
MRSCGCLAVLRSCGLAVRETPVGRDDHEVAIEKQQALSLLAET